MTLLNGYMGKMLRVDLTNERLTNEVLDEETFRKYVGGAGLATKIMYDEVPKGVEWSDPENRMVWACGVLTGTKAPASTNYTVATKGPLTNLLSAAQSNGFFGARLRFAGYDVVVVHGAAKRWVYLHIHDGVAELKDAEHLLGKDAFETEDIIKEEVNERKASVACIGPAGENLVRYACLQHDKGHIAATNGCGAVMGSKKLKAFVVHGNARVPVADAAKLDKLVDEWWKSTLNSPFGGATHAQGTNSSFSYAAKTGWLQVKNLTTAVFPEHAKFNGDALRKTYKGKMKPKPCYNCKFGHIHQVELLSGPHKGERVEEAEFECMSAFGPQIGNTDVDAAMWLSNVNDRLGMDGKEQAVVMGLAIECYEKGVITKADTDGIELTWGNVQAVETIMHKIAQREGFGDVLAEGVRRAAQKIGGDAPKFAVYFRQGNGPHVSDPRGMWRTLFGHAVADNGSQIHGADPGFGETFSEDWGKIMAKANRRGQFVDCLGVCMLPTSGVRFRTITETVSAVTGWEYEPKIAAEVGERVMAVMRAFNIRHGHTMESYALPPRVLEPPPDGPAKGVTIEDVYDKMLDDYHDVAGWDRTGRPLPETLKRLDLEYLAHDLG